MPGQIGNWYSARGRGDGQTDLRRNTTTTTRIEGESPATVFSRARGGPLDRRLTRVDPLNLVKSLPDDHLAPEY